MCNLSPGPANLEKNVDYGADASAGVISAPVGGWRRRYFKVLDLFLNLVISERDLCSGGLEVVGYVWSCRYQTGGRYLLIDLDTENEPTRAVTLTDLLIIIIRSRETVPPSHCPTVVL